MDRDYVVAWAIAFAFTQLIEVPVYRRLLDCSWLRAFGASTITHPLLWFWLFPLLPEGLYTKLVVSELSVWAVEALYFSVDFGPRRALWVTLLANAASFFLGLLSRALLGAP